jgi:S1-C subfamily serine protease
VRRLAATGVLLLLGAAAAAGVRAGEASARSAAAAARLAPAVVRVFGLPAGGFPATGVVLADGSLVLTWSRPAEIGHRVRVSRPGESGRNGAVAARDAATGVTVVRVDGEPFPARIAVGPDPETGEPVLVAGHPYGTVRGEGGPAVGLGVVAQRDPATGRALLSCAVNPGDYGGPVADREGRLVGVMLADQDPVSGLPHAVLLGALRSRLPLIPEAESGVAEPWPVHECLRRAVQVVWPGVVSLATEAEPDKWFSGVVADDQGGVLTTRPGLPSGSKLVAVLPGGGERTALVLGTVERFGVTLLRLEGPDPPVPVRFAEEPPAVGSFVAGVGNPNGRETGRGPLVTVGVVGGVNRSDRRYDAVVTDAAVNRGNAGGVLVDLEGRVVGLLTTLNGSTLLSVGANSGVGFAIPFPPIAGHLEALRRGETVAWRPGYLGVSLSYEEVEGGGVLVEAVVPGLPAEKAGMRAGDVIISVGDSRIGGFEDLRQAFLPLREGEQVKVVIRRDGAEQTFEPVLALRPE